MSSLLFAQLAAQLGTPAALFFSAYAFIWKFGTPEQKVSIIDKYVLFKDGGISMPIGVIVVLAAIVLVAQRTVYKSRLNTKQLEIDRLAAYKTSHQNESLKELHSSSPPKT